MVTKDDDKNKLKVLVSARFASLGQGATIREIRRKMDRVLNGASSSEGTGDIPQKIKSGFGTTPTNVFLVDPDTSVIEFLTFILKFFKKFGFVFIESKFFQVYYRSVFFGFSLGKPLNQSLTMGEVYNSRPRLSRIKEVDIAVNIHAKPFARIITVTILIMIDDNEIIMFTIELYNIKGQIIFKKLLAMILKLLRGYKDSPTIRDIINYICDLKYHYMQDKQDESGKVLKVWKNPERAKKTLALELSGMSYILTNLSDLKDGQSISSITKKYLTYKQVSISSGTVQVKESCPIIGDVPYPIPIEVIKDTSFNVKIKGGYFSVSGNFWHSDVPKAVFGLLGYSHVTEVLVVSLPKAYDGLKFKGIKLEEAAAANIILQFGHWTEAFYSAIQKRIPMDYILFMGQKDVFKSFLKSNYVLSVTKKLYFLEKNISSSTIIDDNFLIKIFDATTKFSDTTKELPFPEAKKTLSPNSIIRLNSTFHNSNKILSVSGELIAIIYFDGSSDQKSGFLVNKKPGVVYGLLGYDDNIREIKVKEAFNIGMKNSPFDLKVIKFNDITAATIIIQIGHWTEAFFLAIQKEISIIVLFIGKKDVFDSLLDGNHIVQGIYTLYFLEADIDSSTTINNNLIRKIFVDSSRVVCNEKQYHKIDFKIINSPAEAKINDLLEISLEPETYGTILNKQKNLVYYAPQIVSEFKIIHQSGELKPYKVLGGTYDVRNAAARGEISCIILHDDFHLCGALELLPRCKILLFFGPRRKFEEVNGKFNFGSINCAYIFELADEKLTLAQILMKGDGLNREKPLFIKGPKEVPKEPLIIKDSDKKDDENKDEKSQDLLSSKKSPSKKDAETTVTEIKKDAEIKTEEELIISKKPEEPSVVAVYNHYPEIIVSVKKDKNINFDGEKILVNLDEEGGNYGALFAESSSEEKVYFSVPQDFVSDDEYHGDQIFPGYKKVFAKKGADTSLIIWYGDETLTVEFALEIIEKIKNKANILYLDLGIRDKLEGILKSATQGDRVNKINKIFVLAISPNVTLSHYISLSSKLIDYKARVFLDKFMRKYKNDKETFGDTGITTFPEGSPYEGAISGNPKGITVLAPEVKSSFVAEAGDGSRYQVIASGTNKKFQLVITVGMFTIDILHEISTSIQKSGSKGIIIYHLGKMGNFVFTNKFALLLENLESFYVRDLTARDYSLNYSLRGIISFFENVNENKKPIRLGLKDGIFKNVEIMPYIITTLDGKELTFSLHDGRQPHFSTTDEGVTFHFGDDLKGHSKIFGYHFQGNKPIRLSNIFSDPKNIIVFDDELVFRNIMNMLVDGMKVDLFFEGDIVNLENYLKNDERLKEKSKSVVSTVYLLPKAATTTEPLINYEICQKDEAKIYIIKKFRLVRNFTIDFNSGQIYLSSSNKTFGSITEAPKGLGICAPQASSDFNVECQTDNELSLKVSNKYSGQKIAVFIGIIEIEKLSILFPDKNNEIIIYLFTDIGPFHDMIGSFIPFEGDRNFYNNLDKLDFKIFVLRGTKKYNTVEDLLKSVLVNAPLESEKEKIKDDKKSILADGETQTDEVPDKKDESQTSISESYKLVDGETQTDEVIDKKDESAQTTIESAKLIDKGTQTDEVLDKKDESVSTTSESAKLVDKETQTDEELDEKERQDLLTSISVKFNIAEIGFDYKTSDGKTIFFLEKGLGTKSENVSVLVNNIGNKKVGFHFEEYFSFKISTKKKDPTLIAVFIKDDEIDIDHLISLIGNNKCDMIMFKGKGKGKGFFYNLAVDIIKKINSRIGKIFIAPEIDSEYYMDQSYELYLIQKLKDNIKSKIHILPTDGKINDEIEISTLVHNYGAMKKIPDKSIVMLNFDHAFSDFELGTGINEEKIYITSKNENAILLYNVSSNVESLLKSLSKLKSSVNIISDSELFLEKSEHDNHFLSDFIKEKEKENVSVDEILSKIIKIYEFEKPVKNLKNNLFKSFRNNYPEKLEVVDLRTTKQIVTKRGIVHVSVDGSNIDEYYGALWTKIEGLKILNLKGKEGYDSIVPTGDDKKMYIFNIINNIKEIDLAIVFERFDIKSLSSTFFDYSTDIPIYFFGSEQELSKTNGKEFLGEGRKIYWLDSAGLKNRRIKDEVSLLKQCEK